MVLCGLDAPSWFCNRIWKSNHVISSSRYVRKDKTRLYFSDPYSNTQYMRSKVSAGRRKFRFGNVVDEVSTGKLRMETLDFSCELPYDPTKEWCAVNSCNGLVCLVNDPLRDYKCYNWDNSVVCVCNPILGEWISIPIPNDNCGCALGFSAKNNQYKILQCIEIGEDHTNLKYKWEIYTLGTGHWRSIETKETIEPWVSYFLLPFNASIHGSLHWPNKSPGPFVVQSFNFETERFTVFSLPERESAYIGDRYLDVELGVINGCLWASLHNGFECDDCEMWAMKEYGDEKSWTMTLAFRSPYEEHDPPDDELLARHKELVIYEDTICWHRLLFTLNGEDMLVWIDRRFSCYNIKTMRYRDARPKLAVSRRTIHAAMQASRIGRVIAYNPSFVSLHDVGKGEQVIRWEFPGKCDKFGGYKCADCGSPRYKSGTRFNSSCGWPAFFEGLPRAINRTKDPDGWRTEISCRACGAQCVQRGGYI